MKGLGHLKNSKSQKTIVYDLEVKCVKEENAMVDHDGIPLIRNVMIRCALALNTNGR